MFALHMPCVWMPPLCLFLPPGHKILPQCNLNNSPFGPARMNEVDLDMPVLEAIEDKNVPLSLKRALQMLSSHGHLVCKPLQKEW